MTLTRRRFLASGAVLASGSAGAVTRALEACSSEPLASAAALSREPLRVLAYDQVRLTGGPLGEQYDAIHAHYLSLSNDRLLKVYRQRAGLPAPGAEMGGWYDRNGFVPGHGLGQYISGLARIGATTGDHTCHQKVAALVHGFAETLGAKNESIVRPDTNPWVCYTLDKHFAGLIDAATLSNLSEAIPLLTRVLEGATPLLPARGRDRIGKKDPPYDETFVMPENLFTAATLTGNPAFERLALRYMLDHEFFDRLARGEDPLPGQHAYSHAIALSSAGLTYLRHGDAKYKHAMQRGFDLLTTEQQFASGGWGPNETFVHPHRGELFASLGTTPDHFETPCGSYAATKLARYLLRTTPAPTDTSHGDNLERVLFNTILAVKPPDSDGRYPYYSTYSPEAQKVYYSKRWPCCSGTLVQTVADYPLNCYFHAEQGREGGSGLYVNLYTPSEVHFTHRGVPLILRQQTLFPSEDTTELSIETPHESEFTLYLRIPAWIAGRATLQVNGETESTPAAGTWATVRRRWRGGDRLLLTLPQDFRFEAIDDKHPDTVALMRGPLQYVALNVPGTNVTLSSPASLRDIGQQRFTQRTAQGELVFVPLYRVANETYTSYFTRA